MFNPEVVEVVAGFDALGSAERRVVEVGPGGFGAAVIERDGRLSRDTPEWITGEAATTSYAELAGKTTFSAREAMVGLLRESGDLEGQPTPTPQGQ